MNFVSRPQAKPFDVQQALNQAVALHHQGRLAEAEQLYSAVLAARPNHFDALQMLGVIKLGRGDHAAALRLTAEAVQQRPNSPQALLNHGNVFEAMGRYDDALGVFDEAIRRKGRFADAHNNRGSVLVSLDRPADALESFERAIAIKADYAEAIYNRGNALRLLDRHVEALKCFDRAIALRPNYAKAHCNRGVALDALGRTDDAIESFDRALALHPNLPEALVNRAGALRGLKRHDEAQKCLDQLMAAHPRFAEGHYMRALVMADLNCADQATASCDLAVALKPDYSKARWGTCTSVLPILYAEESEIATRRAEYERRLQALCADYEAGRIPGDMSKGLGLAQPFFLAYQGYCDRDLQSMLGKFASRIMSERYGDAEIAPPPAPGEPIRVGIVSGYFWLHSVWKVGVRGWLTQLDPKRFQIFVYNPGLRTDAETEIARKHAYRYVDGARPRNEWRDLILADKPHVLLYPEIGMFQPAAELAAMRLAPVQCSYIGHPQTSGYPTIDYFLSGELIEPPNGQDHYCERLVRLPNIGFHYQPLELPPVIVTREQLELRASATVYWCAQSLFKYLPQYDDVFPRIAKQAGDCQFVFIRHSTQSVTDLLQARLERAFAAHGLKASDFCVFLHGMEVAAFAAASALCDVMLDSIGWSGGNTTLEALAQDLPVVTFEAELMRGRVSAGMLRMMGMPEGIAGSIDEYVALAVRIAADPAWQAELKRRVSENKQRLYRDRASIAGLEDFLDSAARQPR
jgi:predicted O-linked N-acetylglucosamine transferase (SPINDLY family)